LIIRAKNLDESAKYNSVKSLINLETDGK